MSTPAARPKAAICAEKKRLSGLYVEALRQVMELQNQQLAALAVGGSGLDRFDLALALARRRRDRAKRLYLLHLSSHSC